MVKSDNMLLVLFNDSYWKNLVGFAPLHKGINGKYQIRTVRYRHGGHVGIIAFGILSNKEINIIVGGSRYSDRIVTYQVIYMWG